MKRFDFRPILAPTCNIPAIMATFLQVQVGEWASNFAYDGSAHVRIDLGGFAATMAQQFLDIPQIGTLFQQMSRKRVTQGMNTALLGYARFPASMVKD